MILLSVDTSGTKGSLALAHPQKKLTQVVWTKKAMHSEVATVELQNLLSQTKVELHELTHLLVNVGPGSFTGLRVGLSLVKTLAYSLGLPVASINTLESLAFSKTTPGEKILVATKAVQNFYYAARYLHHDSGLEVLTAPAPVEESQLAELSLGCTKVLIEGKTAGFEAASEARDLVELMEACGSSLKFSDWKTVQPLYLRASEAEEKLKKGLLRPV